MAKLRMHTDLTLDILAQTTSRLGVEFRKFANKTCAAFDTRELAREAEARKRRQQKKTQARSAPMKPGPARSNNSTAGGLNDTVSVAGGKANGPRPMKFSLRTYKFHALGDYVHTIRRVGTSDSYSTEPASI
jgi:hypothetical protein